MTFSRWLSKSICRTPVLDIGVHRRDEDEARRQEDHRQQQDAEGERLHADVGAAEDAPEKLARHLDHRCSAMRALTSAVLRN